MSEEKHFSQKTAKLTARIEDLKQINIANTTSANMRISLLEEKIASLTEMVDAEKKSYWELHKQNKKLKECVEFYTSTQTNAGSDCGEEARQCLKEIDAD